MVPPVDTNCLSVAHNIFLNKEQRYLLASDNSISIKVVGVSLPVWCGVDFSSGLQTDGPGEEIFCNYEISNDISSKPIEIMDNGYKIFIPRSKTKKRLLDHCDKGCKSFRFTYHGLVELEDKMYKTIHFVSINDENVLLDSLTGRQG